jgi:hypothetical protein
LTDIELLVSKVVKVKHREGVLGHNQGAVHTREPIELGLAESGTTRGEILLLVARLAVERSLGLIEVGGVLGGAGLTLFHLYISATEKSAEGVAEGYVNILQGN